MFFRLLPEDVTVHNEDLDGIELSFNLVDSLLGRRGLFLLISSPPAVLSLTITKNLVRDMPPRLFMYMFILLLL